MKTEEARRLKELEGENARLKRLLADATGLARRADASIMLAVRTIAVINQKGGVGKTTTVANLGAAMAARGKRVCLVDLDPQAHLTLHFGIEPGTPETSTYDVLTGGASLASAAMEVSPTLAVVPSVIDLAAAEVELVGQVGREQVLADAMVGESLDCDLVMIDCPPSLGLLTLNALAAADEVFIPLQPHFLALQGLGKLLETVSLVQRRINPDLRVTGVILCMYETTTRLSGEVVEDLRSFFESTRDGDAPWSGAHIYETVIRRNVKLAECPSYGTTIFDYEPGSHGADDYAALAEEFLRVSGEPQGQPGDAVKLSAEMERPAEQLRRSTAALSERIVQRIPPRTAARPTSPAMPERVPLRGPVAADTL